MEDVELIAVGILFAVVLSITELRCPVRIRIPLMVGLMGATATALFVLHVSIVTNGMDFLQTDVGAFLGAGLIEGWVRSP